MDPWSYRRHGGSTGNPIAGDSWAWRVNAGGQCGNTESPRAIRREPNGFHARPMAGFYSVTALFELSCPIPAHACII